MLKTAKIVGLNSDTAAALAAIFESNSTDRLFLLVFCRVEDAFSRTRQAILEAEDQFTSLEGTTSDRLKETVKSLEKSLSEAEEKEVLLAATQEEENSAVLYLYGKKGLMRAVLERGDKLTDLTGAEGDYQLVSGALKTGDLVVLATGNLLSLIEGSLSDLSRQTVEEIEDEINSRLPQSEGGPVAGILVQMEKITESENNSPEIKPLIEPSNIVKPSFHLEKAVEIAKKSFSKMLPHSTRGVALLGAGLLIIALVGTGLIYNQRKQAETMTKFTTHLQAAATSLNQAKALQELDSAAALGQLTKAKNEISLALDIKPKDEGALNLQQQIMGGSGDILKVYSVGDFPLWLDLDLIKKGFTAGSLSLSHGNLLLLDSDNQTLIKIGQQTKAPQILAGAQNLGQGKTSSLNGDIAWVYSADKGVVKTRLAGSTSVAIKTDSDWGKITEIYGFANNLYLVDEGKNQIWKYVPVESGYSDKMAYFKDGVSAALIGTKRMQIDSSIWVLRGGGELNKYTQGAPDFFSIGGLDKPIKDPKSFFVSDQTDNLYLLDSGNSRLLVFDKKGVYKAQYSADAFANFTDLVVDEAGKKAYFLQGSKIFQMDLR